MRYVVQLSISFSNAVKHAERKIARELKQNPEFGIANEWSTTPRSGAKWTDLENEALHRLVKRCSEAKRKKLDLIDLAVIAWAHGRSTLACYAQLKRCRIYYTYFLSESRCLINN